ncbi:hypothetical protein [Bacillus cereus group sp. MG11]|uniref:hypothetical protein n=1 Tax=Bacillus cereus group sp. MG11 TaxID=3040248 RepID=UPI003396A32C
MASATNIASQVEEFEKQIKQGETIRIQASTVVKTLRDQYKKVADDLETLGVKPSEAKTKIEEIDVQIQEKLQQMKTLLPTDIIKKYANHDFTSNHTSSDQPF